jgi:glycosyltransferase involved in cell wall biosynthesis
MAQPAQHRLAIHFQRYGPYHKARLASARQQLAPIGWGAIGLETVSMDAVYQWQAESHADQAGIHTVFPGKALESLSRHQIQQGMDQVLSHLNPDAVAIAGWASSEARACLAWCRKHSKQALLMSETRAADGRRIWFKEAIKSWRIKPFQGAFVGGASHADYLRSLGFRGPVAYGYDVVDNAYFREESTQWRANDQRMGLISRPYILASNRFVERKNLIRLVQAFAAVPRSDGSPQGAAVDLCLVGDGPERVALQSTCKALGLPVVEAAPWDVEGQVTSAFTSPRVFLPGFRQIEELPRFYAHACCFVHPAISEPWGLVINEAMACGLPVLCSANCGAAEELVIDSINGFSFDPLDTVSISRVLRSFLNLPPEQKAAMGEASSELIEQRYPTSAFGQGLATLLSGLRGP